jgi:hypothetical protein
VILDRTAEGLPLLGVRDREIERAPRDPERLRRDADPPAVERGHRDLEPLALLVEEVRLRHAEILEEISDVLEQWMPSFSSSLPTR